MINTTNIPRQDFSIIFKEIERQQPEMIETLSVGESTSDAIDSIRDFCNMCKEIGEDSQTPIIYHMFS